MFFSRVWNIRIIRTHSENQGSGQDCCPGHRKPQGGELRLQDLVLDFKTLGANIKDLDKMVAEATANRKEENSDFKTLFASDAAAKEVLEFAKNRFNKFYNPK